MLDRLVSYSDETQEILDRIKTLTPEEITALAEQYELQVGSKNYYKWHKRLREATTAISAGDDLWKDSTRTLGQNPSISAAPTTLELLAVEVAVTAAVIATAARSVIGELDYKNLIGPWREALKAS